QSCPMTATLPSASPCTTGPCWAAELVPAWQQLPGALGFSVPCCTLPLCQGNAVDRFFCEIPQIPKLSCSKSYLREVGLVVINALVFFGCFVFILFSSVQIFRAVLRMPSEQGRHKALSTCLPHLAVVSPFVSTAMLAYLKPPSISSPSLDLLVSLLYSVVPPAVNPLIYGLRNQELKAAVSSTFFYSIHKMHGSLRGVPSGGATDECRSRAESRSPAATRSSGLGVHGDCSSLPSGSILPSVFETGLLLPRSNGLRQQQEVVFVLLPSFHCHSV
ncbi:hypothetical protein CIB84_016589, partial [Bambusicola thoracicus]